MNDHQRQIHAYILDHPGCSATQIAEALGLGMSTLRSRMDRMKTDFMLTVKGSLRWQRYWAVPLDPEWKVAEEFEQAPSIWRVASRVAAQARGVEWRAESCSQ